MPYNGQRIEGGCVTQRSHPATDPGTLAEELSRWQDGYGAVFANPGTKLVNDTSVAVQVLLCAECLSRCTNLIKITGAIRVYYPSTDPDRWYRILQKL